MLLCRRKLYQRNCTGESVRGPDQEGFEKELSPLAAYNEEACTANPLLSGITPMQRTTYLALALSGSSAAAVLLTARHQDHERIFPTPADAIKSPPEKLAYVVAVYAGTERQEAGLPGDDRSRSGVEDLFAGRSIACRCPTSATSCTTSAGTPAPAATAMRARRYLIIPGLVSGRIHIVDTDEPARAEAAQGDRAGRGRSRRRS